jgi:hypothetical protein
MAEHLHLSKMPRSGLARVLTDRLAFCKRPSPTFRRCPSAFDISQRRGLRPAWARTAPLPLEPCVAKMADSHAVADDANKLELRPFVKESGKLADVASDMIARSKSYLAANSLQQNAITSWSCSRFTIPSSVSPFVISSRPNVGEIGGHFGNCI